MTTTPLFYRLAEAAEVARVSPDSLRRAIKKVRDDGKFPHPLPAKKGARGEYLIRPDALAEWTETFPDA